mmetsp:Transcript_5363/g.11680  ORF Transcript_5363/g.11680 Transcript_5363/m.11680 type:complete len:218 (-) Transcript_5363:649-1302(-)
MLISVAVTFVILTLFVFKNDSTCFNSFCSSYHLQLPPLLKRLVSEQGGLSPFWHHQTYSFSVATMLMASPILSALPTRPMRWTYVAGSSGSIIFTTNGSSRISIPLAATSVAIRILTSPSLNALRLACRSCIDRIPASTRQENLSLFTIDSFETLFKKHSKLSQSRFVRQNTRTLSISNRSSTSINTWGFMSFMRSLCVSSLDSLDQSVAAHSSPWR